MKSELQMAEVGKWRMANGNSVVELGAELKAGAKARPLRRNRAKPRLQKERRHDTTTGEKGGGGGSFKTNFQSAICKRGGEGSLNR